MTSSFVCAILNLGRKSQQEQNLIYHRYSINSIPESSFCFKRYYYEKTNPENYFRNEVHGLIKSIY